MSALPKILIGVFSLLLAAGEGIADGGQCRWEGGLGLADACKVQDCPEDGGSARCSDPVIVPPSNRTKADVDEQLYAFAMCHVEGGWNATIDSYWCSAGLGTYTHFTADDPCIGVSTSSYYRGNPGAPLRDSIIVPTGLRFSKGPLGTECGDPSVINDTGWSYASSQYNHCWAATPVFRNGEDLLSFRRITYQGYARQSDGSCGPQGTQDIMARRGRALACPAGHTQRFKPNGDLQCVRGVADGMCPKGNPTRPGSGTKLQTEVDFTAAGPGSLQFSRHYNSIGYFRAGSGSADQLLPWKEYWKHTYDRRLYPLDDGWVALQFPDDVIRYFDAQGKETQNRDGQGHSLSPGPGNGWLLTKPNHDQEYYDASGRLVWVQTRGGLRTTLHYDPAGLLEAVVDHFGRSLVLDYDQEGRLTGLLTPDDQSVIYSYNDSGMLAGVLHADQTSRSYHYEHEGNPYLLTGFTNEKGVRQATYTYDSNFRVTRSTHIGDAGRTDFSYPSATRTIMTDALGTARNIDYAIKGGVLKQTAMSQPCASCGGSNQSLQYDDRGNVIVRVEFGGRRTHYEYEPVRNLETLRTEGLDASGATTPQTRTVATQWHPTWRLPERIERSGGGEPVRVETFVYDAAGNQTERAVSASGVERRWTSVYDSLGRITESNGPRTDIADVSTYAYFADDHACSGCRGQLRTVTNALGHVTEYLDYDAAGRPLRIRDANQIESALTYDLRGRLKTRTADAGGATPLTTTLHYDDAGLLVRTQSPESETHFAYDDAQRLVAVSDALGNRIEYVLDAAGNRREERTLDPQGQLQRRVRREIDALGRTLAQLNGNGHATHFEYDAADRVVAQLDPNQQLTVSGYDALGRLVSSQDPLRGDTAYQYDSADRLIGVTDAEGRSTAYQYHPLGDLLQLVSPDTGTTSYTYDAAGQRATQTDARGVQTTYQYDALGRITAQTYAASSLNVSFVYDQADGVTGCTASHPLGRLTTMQDASGSSRYCYDAHGRLSTKLTTVAGQSLTVGYRYDGDGRVVAVKYPSGGELLITRDAAGRPISASWLSPGGQTIPVLTQISHLPFGPITQVSFGNGLSQTRAFDADYRLVALDGLDIAADERHFAYDELQRLSQESGPAGADAVGYTYDAIGNRLAEIRDSATEVYTYAADSHRLLDVAGGARGYDANGNSTAIGSAGLNYDARNRLVAYTGTTTASYEYNGRGERVQKQAGGQTLRFAYDEAGHLLGEYTAGGSPRQEFLWLDDLPIGVVQADGSVLSIQADHLQTPRALADAAGTMVWRWALGGEAFGGSAAEADPDGNGVAVEFNLRFPGQYFDAESGLHYNMARDYDSVTGRYVQSDPLGLNGGINTFAYVRSSPMTLMDPSGQVPLNTNNCMERQRQELRRALDQVARDWNRCYGGKCEERTGSPMIDMAQARDFLEVAMSSIWIQCSGKMSGRCAQMSGSAHSPSRSAPVDRVGAARAGGLWPLMDIELGCNPCLNQTIFHELLHYADTYGGQAPENSYNHELINEQVQKCAPCLMEPVRVVSQ